MNSDLVRRIVWVVSLVLVLVGCVVVLAWRGVEWGIGAAP